jgi:hypothetical protein
MHYDLSLGALMKSFVACAAIAVATFAGPVLAAGVCKNATMDGLRVLTASTDGFSKAYDVGGGANDEGYGSAALPDDVSFQFYNTGTGFHSGSFNLGTGDNNNYQTCSECLLVFQDIDTGTGNAAKTFFQSQGTLVIDPTTPPGSDPIKMSWTNVILVEVTIDPNTYFSTPVENGDCYNIVSDTVFANGFESAPSG